jgi:hypothetical protein
MRTSSVAVDAAQRQLPRVTRTAIVTGRAVPPLPAPTCHTFPRRPSYYLRVRRHGVGFLLLASAVGGACGGDDSARSGTPAYVSGSRLRARVYDAGDARVFVAWHDSQRDEDCSFARATDGQWRCLPGAGSAAYLDPDCTTPVVVISTSGPLPRSVRGPSQGFDGCDADTALYPVYGLGAATTTATTYQPVGSNCQATTVDSTQTVFAVGPAVDPAEFVGAVIVDEARGRRLAAQLFRADDGAQQIVSIFDTHRNQVCALPPLNLETGPCLPTDLAYAIGEFADAACSEPSGFAYAMTSSSGAACPAPSVALSFTFSACGDVTLGFNQLGDVVQTVFVTDSNGQCVAKTPEAIHVNHLLGPAIAASEFVTLFHDAVGSGRLRSREIAVSGGGRFMTDYRPFFDAQLDAPCEPTPFCDGSTRCLPDLPSSSPYFTDAACTQPIALVSENTACSTATPPTRVIVDPTGSDCYGPASIYELGAAFDPPAVWTKSPTDGSCVSTSVDQGTGFRFHALGAALPLDSFAAVTLGTE